MRPPPDITFDPEDTETKNISRLELGVNLLVNHVDVIKEKTNNNGNSQCQTKTRRSFWGKS